MKNNLDEYIKKVETQLTSTSSIKPSMLEVGRVEEIRDGVVIASGLNNASYGEVVEFASGVKGYIIDLTEDRVGIIVLGDYLTIAANDQIKAVGYTLSVPVSDDLLGRVVDPLCNPQDGLAPIKSDQNFPVEKIAPTVVYRKSVSVPLLTGIKAIDALIPIGRGQRELIIGDRGTGKTTIALDTILSQKGENVICIYAGVGQKNSKMALVIDLLRKHKALDYSVVVNASASDSVSMQYIAPYSACAIGEYFMSQGKDVLVIYDDLSKHAWAYRQISLILRRPAGREAYPGDIFYLHSRLLERACRIDDKYGGGSITALPIVETLEGDMSAYIPTNIISITDGQIFLETDLFNKGMRPAINAGLSVSRVGSSAQTKAMKKVSGRIKLELAQFRELEAFMQFAQDLDADTKKRIDAGQRLMAVLRQKNGQPLPFEHQAIVIYSAVNGYLEAVPVERVPEYEGKLLDFLSAQAPAIAQSIARARDIAPQTEAELKLQLEKFAQTHGWIKTN